MAETNLLHVVIAGLGARKGEWKRIADELDGVSYSMIAQLGRGKYKSSPTVGKLEKLAAWLREHPAEKAAA
jgi:hypothetical protein